MTFFLPPTLKFNFTMDKTSKDKFRENISHIMCLNNLNKYSMEISNSSVFVSIGPNFTEYDFTITIPEDLTYVDDRWTCSFPQNVFRVYNRSYPISMTNDELIYILAHEVAHHKNGDNEPLKIAINILHTVITHPLVLGIIFYCGGIYMLIFTVIINHMLSWRSRRIEKRTDLCTFKISNDIMKSSKLLWGSLSAQLPESDIVIYLHRIFNSIFCGSTHPSHNERILYSS